LSRGGGSFWPSGTQRALMEVGLGPEEVAAARWQALQPLDVTKLSTGSFGLLPPLYERLRETVPDDPQLPRLLGTYRSVWYRNQLLLERLAVLLPLLRRRTGSRPVLVGGMSALLRWYPRLGLRPVPQLDLVVEPDHATDAVKVSTYAGWRRSAQSPSSTVLRDESRRVLVIHHGSASTFIGSPGGEGLTAVRERALELDAIEGTPLVLDPADELVSICATGARTAPVQTCQWLVDVHYLLRSPSAPTPAALIARAREAHQVASVQATLHHLAEIVGRDAFPAHLASFQAEPIEARDRLAFALAGRDGRFAATAQILAGYVRATADEPPLRAVAGLPRYLQERWEATRLAAVPLLATRKALRLFGSQGRAPAAERNRSASS